ncbi:MAG: replication protein P [Halieaceae bacterium]|jgi:hypothetical protein|nr:replication protein P [Halieaceae bacterium]
MEESTKLAARVAREIAASSTTSRTPAGPTDSAPTEPEGARVAPGRSDPALVEAINQVFALFRLNYHNQYYAAFSDAEQLRQIKKLWLESLRDFPVRQILQGARLAIDSGEYLPTLHRMRSCCEDSLPALGLPAAREAYAEAANAAAPPERQSWSHPLVYWAAHDCGWRRLAASTEAEGWPLFRDSYQARCRRFLDEGQCPPVPEPPAKRLESKALDREDALAAVRELRRANEL